MRVIFLLGFLQGIVLSTVLFTRRSKDSSNKILGALILLLSIQLGLTSEGSRLIQIVPDLRGLAWTMPYLFAPLTFLYLRSLLTKRGFGWSDLTHLIPFFLSILGLVPYFQLEHLEKVNFDISASSYFLNFAIGFETFRVIQAIFYAFLIFRLIKRFKTAALSEISDIPLNWVYQFVYASMISWAIAFLSILAYFTSDDLVVNPFNIVYLMTLIFIYMLGFKMVSSPVIFGFSFDSFNQSDGPTDRYAKSGLKDEHQSEYLKSLSDFMNSDKPYLESDITISDLADRLQIPKHHLSQLINENLNQNFFDFINSHRIEYAKKLLEDPSNDHLKILAIAYDAGFNSKSTFNSLFKKYTGVTPTKFRETTRTN